MWYVKWNVFFFENNILEEISPVWGITHTPVFTTRQSEEAALLTFLDLSTTRVSAGKTHSQSPILKLTKGVRQQPSNSYRFTNKKVTVPECWLFMLVWICAWEFEVQKGPHTCCCWDPHLNFLNAITSLHLYVGYLIRCGDLIRVKKPSNSAKISRPILALSA